MKPGQVLGVLGLAHAARGIMITALDFSAKDIAGAPTSSEEAAEGPALAKPAPRIYYVNPLLGGALRDWPPLLDHAARLGFDYLLIAPPFATGRTGDLFLPADFSRLHPSLAWGGDAAAGLHWLSRECGQRDLRLLLDVVPDRLAAGSVAARERPDLFAGPEDLDALDPRHGHGGSEAARARLEFPELGQWWADQARDWVEAGVAGFRVLRLGHLPSAALRRTLEGLRQHASESLLLGWTPGLPLDHLPELEGIGLDFVFSSLPWWDFRADWFWTEADALSRIAPVIAAPEAPFGARLLGSWHDPAEQLAAYRRALLFAAGIGPGWLMPMGFEYGAAQSLDPARDAARTGG